MAFWQKSPTFRIPSKDIFLPLLMSVLSETAVVKSPLQTLSESFGWPGPPSPIHFDNTWPTHYLCSTSTFGCCHVYLPWGWKWKYTLNPMWKLCCQKFVCIKINILIIFTFCLFQKWDWKIPNFADFYLWKWNANILIPHIVCYFYYWMFKWVAVQLKEKALPHISITCI